MYYTYVAKQEKKKRFYIGHTSNLEMQLRKYNCPGKDGKSSPAVYIVHYEMFSSENEACRREREIKEGKLEESFALALS